MGFLLFFDLTNEQSFLNIRSWLDQLKQHSYCESPDIILCGNKADLQDLRSISEERAKKCAETYGLPYIETSAATGQNVGEAVTKLLDLVMKRMEEVVDKTLLPAQYVGKSDKSGVNKLDKSNEEKSSSCSC